MRKFLAAGVVALSLFSARLGRGEEPGYLHEGFFLRASAGGSVLRTSGSIASQVLGTAGLEPTTEYTMTALGWGGGLAVGAALKPGLILAGSMDLMSFSSRSIDGGAGGPAASGSTSGFGGAMLDVYPDPSSGWHVGGVVGFGVEPKFVFENRYGRRSSVTPLGPCVALHAGKGWWIGPGVSLGVLGRLTYIEGRQRLFDGEMMAKDHTLITSIALTAEYN